MVMRRLLLSSLLLAAPAAAAGPLDLVRPLLPEPRPGDFAPPAYLDAQDVAELDLRAGRYRRVLADPAAAPRTRAAALMHLGGHDAARAATDDALLLARIDLAAGDLPAARARLADLVADRPDLLQARLLLGRAAERAGDLDAARASYGWFAEQDFLRRFDASPDDPAFADADDLVAIGTALDRLATLNGGYERDGSLHDAIFDLFVTAYDVVDRGNVEAHVAAAEFAHARSDGEKTAEELAAALSLNPRHPAALRLAGRVQVERFGFAEAEKVVAAMRAVDADSRDADVLESLSLLRQRQADRAMRPIARVLDARPDDLEALGLLAAARATLLDFDGQAEAVARAEAIDSDNASVYLEIGEQLSLLRQYDRAADALRTAADRAAWWTRPLNALGLLYTQSGEEASARAALTRATAVDPFNAETRNYLKLLEEMRDYERVEGGGFVVRHADDALAADLMAATLGPMGEEVDATFGWTPPVATEVQVFPTHSRFSVRVAGDPYVGTVGACTGPVIALVSPRDGEATLGAFDWLRVMRHEYAHTVTLGATHNRIWHWLTEGLAVREEHRPEGLGAGAPPRDGQLALLADAARDGGLFPVEGLTWGFVRPRKPTDRSLAYAQSWQACEFVAGRWGEAALMDLMHAAGDGLTERAALEAVLGVAPESFDAEFAAWLDGRLAAWGMDPAGTAAYAAAMRAGDAALRAGDLDAAAGSYADARRARRYDADAARRLAGVHLKADRPSEAAETLMFLARSTTNDARYAKRAARLFLDAGDAEAATEAAWLAVRCGSYDRAAHELLLRAAEASGDAELAEAQGRRLGLLE